MTRWPTPHQCALKAVFLVACANKGFGFSCERVVYIVPKTVHMFSLLKYEESQRILTVTVTVTVTGFARHACDQDLVGYLMDQAKVAPRYKPGF
jgi:hypothetical protein